MGRVGAKLTAVYGGRPVKAALHAIVATALTVGGATGGITASVVTPSAIVAPAGMAITATALKADYAHISSADKAIFTAAEKKYSLPRLTLTAVCSRETNCTDEYGDYGVRNGRSGPLPGGAWAAGFFQLDAGSHIIPAGFLSNITLQADTAASMLHGLLVEFGGDQRAAFAAYNAGAGTVEWNLRYGYSVDSGTAGGNYGADVAARLAYLQATYPAPKPAVVVKQVYGIHYANKARTKFVVRGPLDAHVSLRSVAASLLTAKASATAVEVVLQRLVKANPPLKGKTYALGGHVLNLPKGA